jgi:glycosyltransferase involved in cell wall biosynthesis
MLKGADALHGAGWRVRVVSASHTGWAAAADRSLRQSRRWDWTVVDYARETAPRRRILSGARFRAARSLVDTTGISRAPIALARRAYSRIHDELVAAILAEPADLVYGGTTGALAAVAEGADRLGVPYGLDLEDLHSGETIGADSEHVNALAGRIERDVLPAASFLTAGSPMIADAYATTFGVPVQPIHNTFSRDFDPAPKRGPRLRMYWMSQTLGPGRGLEDVVRAAGQLGTAAALHLRARATAEYAGELHQLQRASAPDLDLVYEPLAPPDEMVKLSHGYDLGLACEVPESLNRQLCLSNKIFTYLAAGLPVVLSATRAQAQLASELGPAALLYESGDVDALAEHLRRWAGDPVAQRTARDAARDAADRRWHWEHPDDRGRLLELIDAAVAVAS